MESHPRPGYPHPDPADIGSEGLTIAQDTTQLWKEHKHISTQMAAAEVCDGEGAFGESYAYLSNGLDPDLVFRLGQLCYIQRKTIEVHSVTFPITITCHSLDAVEDLWHKTKSGELSKILNTILEMPLSQTFNLETLKFEAIIEKEEYERVKSEFTTDALEPSPIALPRAMWSAIQTEENTSSRGKSFHNLGGINLYFSKFRKVSRDEKL